MIAKFMNHLKKAERGQSIIILAFAFVVLLGFVGLTTDVSLMFVRYATIRRAVDSASLAAATQMRQGTEEAAVAIAARQFVEFHGLDSVKVLVETCQTIDQANPDMEAIREELCTADQRKLVKVTAQIESPTVFLRLLGWENFTLQASAISETAALDVVLIMDVSESMLIETSYDDWAKIGMGFVYYPPNAEQDIADGKGIPRGEYWINELQAAPNGQSEINARLWYNGPMHATTTTEPEQDPYYEVEVYQIEGHGVVDSMYTDPDEFPANVSALTPREGCRVRYSPISQLESGASKNGRELRDGEGDGEFLNLALFYDELGVDPDKASRNWNGFVPTYDYYACCNDPGTHASDADGPIYQNNGYVQMSSDSVDFNFTDLVCQPFKGARDAVELFLAKIDFIRGDRVAFVTFDRSAFLINPWNLEGQNGGLSHMIDRYDVALNTLRRVVGVRAEPNFYVWNVDDDTSGELDSSGWVSLAAGIDRGADGVTGSVAIDYDSATGGGTLNYVGDPIAPTSRISHNYPIRNNCYYFDATNPTVYSQSGLNLRDIAHPYGANLDQDDATVRSWGSEIAATDLNRNPGSRFRYDGLDWFTGRVSYELVAECRGTNIGAALREGNNALLDPDTSRRFGAIWVMVLLSDGAAGASDPVRRNGDKLRAPNPYPEVGSPTQGEYGIFGVCPYGFEDGNSSTINEGSRGELTDIVKEMNLYGSPQFPFCSDEEPETRHECDFRPERDGADAMWDNNFDETPNDDDGNPIIDTQEIVEWNQARGNLYDVDIGTQDCTFYDVDDYARDWADFIALRDEDSAVEELLPTIYTIGFGLTFGGDADPDPRFEPAISNWGSPPPNANNKERLAPDFLGEQMLRYIADVGDNNRLDNDYYQNYADDTVPGGFAAEFDEYGFRGPCQDQTISPEPDGTYDADGNGSLDQFELMTMYQELPPRENCGNYFNAPSADELEFVFDSIASKLFTRLTG